MGFRFRVVDLRTEVIVSETIVEDAESPEDAARRVLGIEVSRAGPRIDLVARVYWEPMGDVVKMVRIYSKPDPAIW